MGKTSLYSSLKAKLLLFFILFSSLSFSQDSLIIPGHFTDFSIDNLGNIYTVANKDTLFKYSKTEVMHNYKYVNSSLGEISKIDSSNPMQIIVLHDQVSTLVFLDVTLREIQRIQLPGLQIFSKPIAFAQNADGSIWLYDDVNASIIRINSMGEELDKSLSLIQQLGFVPTVSQMQANNQYIVLHDKQKGFIILDQFGEFIKFIPRKNVSDFQLIYKHIALPLNGQLKLQSIEVAGIRPLKGVTVNKKQFLIYKNYLYQLSSKGITKSSLVTEQP